MKKLFLFLPLFLLLACSVQKRRYQNGFYVDWHSKSSQKESYAVKTSKKPLPEGNSGEITKQEVLAEKTPELTFKNPDLYKSIKPLSPPTDTCDVLVFKDGSEIKGKVKEVGATEIKYKRCDTPEGPTYISKSSDIFMIKYANGSREVVKSEPPGRVQSPEPVRNRPNGNQTTDYRRTKYNRQVHPLAIASLVFAVLAIVVLYAALLFLSAPVFPYAILILPFIFALIALITGIVALRKIKDNSDVYKGKGLALPGMIMGMVIASFYIIALFFLLLLLSI